MLSDRIVDYGANKDKVDKWIRLKGEWRYSEYADFLDKMNIRLTWSNLSGTYRYDKRLMFNIFRYLSMYEEYARAEYLRSTQDTKEHYSEVQKWTIFKLEKQSGNLIPDEVRELRNLVSHAKPLVTNPRLGMYIRAFHDALPEDYRKNFRKSIRECKDKIRVPKKIRVVFDNETT